MIEINWRTALRFWWAYKWRGALICAVAMMVVSFMGALINQLAVHIGKFDGLSQKGLGLAILAAYYVASLPLSLWMMKIALERMIKRGIITVAAPKNETPSEV